jgi:uncharacterized protein YbaR (Trm112 family)
MTDIIACPACSQRLRVPMDKGDLSVRCPKCRHTWDWPTTEVDHRLSPFHIDDVEVSEECYNRYWGIGQDTFSQLKPSGKNEGDRLEDLWHQWGEIFEQEARGLLVQADDLEVGQFYAVHGQKNAFDGFECPAQNAGLAFKILAMNLPFVVGKFVCNPACYPYTLDSRFVTLMRVSDEFVKAQRPDAGQGS